MGVRGARSSPSSTSFCVTIPEAGETTVASRCAFSSVAICASAPASGMVTQKLADKGELIAPRAPLLVIADLDHVWANVYVDEPLVPRVTLGQAATVFTDAGGPGIEGTITFISPKAEFTPRNVQTAEERSKLVFRVKVTVNNEKGVLKQGMPVEAEIRFAK